MNFRKTILLTFVWVLSTTTLIRVVNHLLPTADGMIGHDYRYFLPYLLSGVQWFSRNGWLTIPYFTPDYCGGVPWLPNPLSIFYSVPQILTQLTDPVTALNWTTVIFATIGAAATYGLLRRSFGLSWQAAGLSFVLFQLNGFLLFRMAAGHIPYHIFGLIPVLCWLVLQASPPNRQSSHRESVRCASAIIIGGILLAMMVYGGATNLIVPVVLSVAAIVLIHQIGTGWHLAPWCALIGAGLWAIPLSAIKLFPSYIFIRSYPRSYIPDYLFSDPVTLAKSLLRSLFAPELLPNFITLRPLGSWLGVHEFEYGVSVIPLLFVLAAIFQYMRRPSRPQHIFAWIGLTVIVIIPIALTIGTEAWGRTLLKLPIVNNNTTFVRWWFIYTNLLIVATALLFDRLVTNARLRDVVFVGSIFVVIVQLMSRDLNYYEKGNRFELYDPTAVVEATGRVSAGVPLPEISRVGVPPPRGEAGLSIKSQATNDGLIWGISAYPCYEPVFGYFGSSGELFPAHQLRTGSVKLEIDGHLNFVDPRCYLSPEAGICRPGDLFRSDEKSDLEKFTSHQPLPWQRPWWQTFAEVATAAFSIFSVLALLAIGAVAGRKLRILGRL